MLGHGHLPGLRVWDAWPAGELEADPGCGDSGQQVMSQTALLDDWLGGTPRPGTAGVDETASAGAIEMALTGRVSHGCKGAGMSNPLDVQRNLDHCMLNMKGASEAMADDMHDLAGWMRSRRWWIPSWPAREAMTGSTGSSGGPTSRTSKELRRPSV